MDKNTKEQFDKMMNDYEFAEFRVDVSDIDFDNLDKKKEKKPKKKVWKILGIIFLVVALLCGAGAAGVYLLLGRVNYDDGKQKKAEGYGFYKIDAQLVLRNEGVVTDTKYERTDTDGEDIVNFLLIGEESLDAYGQVSESVGRSDSMMVLTINKVEKTAKLTSFMRDMYVDIPGYSRNKLNATFSLGGAELLSSTLHLNFGIHIDGYVKVNFTGFMQVIDQLGGVEVELTDAEALYLNTTNYISDPAYRYVVPGKQTMNGVQALGYCRVRKRACITGENDDFGRTARQRMVLEQIFEKYKSASIIDMVDIIYDNLDCVTTDLTKKEIVSYAKMALELNLEELESFRIPIENSYVTGSAPVGNSTMRSSVVMASREINTLALKSFLYGENFKIEDHLKGNEHYNETLFWEEVNSGKYNAN